VCARRVDDGDGRRLIDGHRVGASLAPS